ncbi:MAG: leucyl aminopeptidase [Chlamydiales bacterium]|jgi:leucyl aminopeptidase|nr:leucyl aminopeptidase [Chlamydiales bacterium]
MIKITHISGSKKRKHADVVICPMWQTKTQAQIALELQEFDTLIKTPLSDFSGKKGETLLLYREKGIEKRVLLLGLGEKAACQADVLRQAYASAIKQLRTKKLKSCNVLLPFFSKKEGFSFIRASLEGFILANYTFDRFKSIPFHPPLENACICGVDPSYVSLLKKVEQIMQGVYLTRDLVNNNADDSHVESLIKVAKDLSKDCKKLNVVVLREKQLKEERMHLLLAVGKASVHPPALVILEYRGDPSSEEKIALVGKGITFDTGGLNLKTTGNIETMKCDMAGSACVLGVIQSLCSLRMKRNVIGVLALAENAISSNSYKPGDVYTSRLGKTVEIGNTDAEGRLVLADALSYVEDTYAPSVVIDFATLTGAIVIALGEEAAGLFSNNDSLVRGLQKAALRTDERLWRLPLYPEHAKMLKSEIADLKNVGGRPASSCTAAAFLQQFIKKAAWAHLDIAGVAYLSKPKSYHPTLATGAGVRVTIDFLEHFDEKDSV